MADEETKTVTKKTVKAHCPTCDGERTCEVHGTVYKPWDWEDKYSGHSMNGGTDHSLLECCGCETVFYETQSWNSEDVEYYHDLSGDTQSEVSKEILTYPKPESKTKPVWFSAMAKIDVQLFHILQQMYIAGDNNAHILTAIGLRTALDRSTEVLGIDPAKSFAKKLNELQAGGWIGESEKNVLEVVTDAGNAAAHRGWMPSSEEMAQLVVVMEVFLHRAFIVGQAALSIKGSIPAKPKQIAAPAPAPKPTA